MAGWTGLPIASGDAWHSLAFVKQFITAVNERATAVGEATLNVPSAGWNIQSCATTPAANTVSWRQIQDKIEAICVKFVNSVTYSGGFEDNTNENLFAYGTAFWTWADLKYEAGLDVNGWTRKYGTAGSISTGYGSMVAGDCLGHPAMFNELRAAMDLLIWTAGKGGDYWVEKSDGTGMRSLYKVGLAENEAGWEAALIAAQNEWDGHTPTSSDGPPNAFAQGNYNGHAAYTALLERHRSYVKGKYAVESGKTPDADYYVFAVDFLNWENNGDYPSNKDGKWHKFLTDSPVSVNGSDLPVSSIQFGKSWDYPTSPSAPSEGTSTVTGWASANDFSRALIKHNVPGAFTYY